MVTSLGWSTTVTCITLQQQEITACSLSDKTHNSKLYSMRKCRQYTTRLIAKALSVKIIPCLTFWFDLFTILDLECCIFPLNVKQNIDKIETFKTNKKKSYPSKQNQANQKEISTNISLDIVILYYLMIEIPLQPSNTPPPVPPDLQSWSNT